jgi:hypothetical protein
MTFDELYRVILEVCPNAQLGEDNEGQVVVYTDLMIDPGSPTGQVVAFVAEDEEGAD